MKRVPPNRKKQHILTELIKPIILVLSVVFFGFIVGGLFYYEKNYTKQEVENKQQQMEKALINVTSLQATIENIAKQLAASTELQKGILKPKEASADYILLQTDIKEKLAIYPHILEYVQEVLVYTVDGRTYSSMKNRGDFVPQKESWYMEFKESGASKGFAKIHMSSASQNNQSYPVLSYVMTFYSIENHRKELGDLIISIDQSYLSEIIEIDMTNLIGYEILEESGNIIFSKNKSELSNLDILECKNPYVLRNQKNNICIVKKSKNNVWIMAVEISSKLINQKKLSFELGIIFAFLMLVISIMYIIIRRIRCVIEPINQLSEAAEKFGQGSFDIQVNLNTTNVELELLISTFNQMVKNINYYMTASIEHEKALRKSQIDQLMLQINPHFICNTLNSIVYMARMEKNQKIIDFGNAFIALLQTTLYVDNALLIPIGDELKNVENYLILQKIRYMDKFDTSITCPDELKKNLIPKVILQPIVENAIFHGLAPLEGRGNVNIIVESNDESTVKIIVEDDGIGIDKNNIDKMYQLDLQNRHGMRKIGIANVYRRIKEISGEEYGFTIISEVNKGTKIIITLPKLEKEVF